MEPTPDATTLPTFLIIGAMKAGTTALAATLAEHPDVWMSPVKEPHFFVPGWPAERRGLDWYRSLFAPGADRPCRGEASTTYTMAPAIDGVAPRIAALLPEVRLVYVVRDPVERIRSMYLHAVASGRERRSLRRAVTEDRRYVDPSRYAAQLARYADHVDPSRILVVRSDDLRHGDGAALRRVYAHIGADPSAGPATTVVAHVTTDKRAPRRLAHAVPGLARRVAGGDVPGPARRLLLRDLRPDEATVDDELRTWLADELAEDQAELAARWLP